MTRLLAVILAGVVSLGLVHPALAADAPPSDPPAAVLTPLPLESGVAATATGVSSELKVLLRKPGLVEQSEVQLDARGNVLADTEAYATSRDGVFSCGDMRRGQSLVVWAIREGRQCARAVDLHLMGASELPR